MEITTPRHSRPMICAVLAQEDPAEHATTPTMALETSLATNVTGTILTQSHAEVSIPKTSRQEICAASVVAVTNQVVTGTSQALACMSSST